MREIVWVGSVLDDLNGFPQEVKRGIGFALRLAQAGERHTDAKPLKGFGGAGVLEVVHAFDGDTWRAVYTVRLSTAVYVLHAFQKKSRRGIGTPREDLKLVSQRLKWAEQLHLERLSRWAGGHSDKPKDRSNERQTGHRNTPGV